MDCSNIIYKFILKQWWNKPDAVPYHVTSSLVCIFDKSMTMYGSKISVNKVAFLNV